MTQKREREGGKTWLQVIHHVCSVFLRVSHSPTQSCILMFVWLMLITELMGFQSAVIKADNYKTIRLLIMPCIMLLLICICYKTVSIRLGRRIQSCILMDDNNNLANSALWNTPLGMLSVFVKCGFCGKAQCFVFDAALALMALCYYETHWNCNAKKSAHSTVFLRAEVVLFHFTHALLT